MISLMVVLLVTGVASFLGSLLIPHLREDEEKIWLVVFLNFLVVFVLGVRTMAYLNLSVQNELLVAGWIVSIPASFLVVFIRRSVK